MQRAMVFGVVSFVLGLLTNASAGESPWTNVGIMAKDLAIGGTPDQPGNLSLWTVGMDGNLYYSTETSWAVPYAVGPQFNLLDVSTDGTPWGVSTSWEVHRGTGAGWSDPLHGTTWIFVDSQNVPWIRFGHSQIAKLEGAQFVTVPGLIGLGVAVTPAGDPVVIGNGSSLWYQGSIVSDQHVRDVEVDERGQIFIVGVDGRVHLREGSGWKDLGQPYADGKNISLARIAVQGGQLFVTSHSSGDVYKRDLSSGPPPVNRPPLAPTLLGPPNVWEPALAQGSGIELTWRHNGDPDGDALTSWLNILRWDPLAAMWREVFAGEVPGTNFVFKREHGLLAERGYYAWGVASLETAATRLFTYSAFIQFQALPMFADDGGLDVFPDIPDPETSPDDDPVPFEELFVRGDANADGFGDLSDAVRILEFLFLGEEAPLCLKSADVDDTGEVLLTDPVFLLNYLFLGKEAPPPPHEFCGEDLTPDALPCELHPPCLF